MQTTFIRKDYITTDALENDGVVWIEHKLLASYKEIRHAFSTRIGGVSKGALASMNLRNCKYDTLDNYKTNIQKFCSAAGFNYDRIVASAQSHSCNVELVREEDCPKGTLFGDSYSDVDGLITDVPGITLVTSFADCIPLFFYDPVRRVVATAHAGWRGTVGGIGRVVVEKMQDNYGSNPENIVAAIGPGICRDCYEVSEDLYEEFGHSFDEKVMSEIFSLGREGHYQLDLWKANYYVLMKSGILKEHISITDICTKCNSDKFFSRRAMGDVSGNQCGFISINE